MTNNKLQITDEELFNNIYGFLKPLRYSDVKIDNRPSIVCECTKCGNPHFVVQRKKLLSGHTKSCGCYHPQENDLIGQTFGRLKVVEKTIERDSKGRIMWKCECQCEDKTVLLVSTSSLKSGNTRSCGCMQLENGYESYYGKNVFERYSEENKNGTTVTLLRNKKPSKRNTSGVVGVSYDSSRNKWVAQLRMMGVNYNLGRYDTFEEAVSIRKTAEKLTHEDFVKWYDENIKGKGKQTEYVANLLEIPDRRKHSACGVTGVHYDRKRNKYHVAISYFGKSYFLGRYTNLEEARKVREEAELHKDKDFLDWYDKNHKTTPIK